MLGIKNLPGRRCLQNCPAPSYEPIGDSVGKQGPFSGQARIILRGSKNEEEIQDVTFRDEGFAKPHFGIVRRRLF